MVTSQLEVSFSTLVLQAWSSHCIPRNVLEPCLLWPPSSLQGLELLQDLSLDNPDGHNGFRATSLGHVSESQPE